MGEEVVPSYLRSKLSSILDEADADSGSPSHIISRFRSIETEIKDKSPMMIPVDLLYELIELVSECRVFSFERRTAAVSKKGFGFYFPKRLLHPLSELMFNRRMRRRLDSIIRKIGDCTTNPPLPVIAETHPIEDPSLIIGFEAEADKIEAWLMPSQEEEEGAAAAALRLRAVGIVGRCGCGKTALAQKVFDSPRIVEEFSPRIWVCLSNMLQFVDRKVRVVNHILKKIPGHDDGRGVDEVQRGLMGKRYLIVLDNAWRLDEWYEELLSRGLPTGSGGAVIVTSRREDVIPPMIGDDEHVIRLQPNLSDEICWQIFSQVLQQQGKLDITNPKLSSIRDDVKRRIDGLPLAAKTLADILPNLLLKTYWVRAFPSMHMVVGENGRFLAPSPYLSINAYVDLKELLINTSYSAYLVFKLERNHRWMSREAKAQVSIVWNGKSPECEQKSTVCIDSEGMQRKGEEEQGWMEMKLGHIFTTLGDDDDGRLVQAELFHKDFASLNSGLNVEGIEFRPDYY